MATQIRRCLYVGLGGTGVSTLLYLKKMFVDTYGEVPPSIGFLGIDSDNAAYTVSLKAQNGQKEIRLDPNEQISIVIDNAMDVYNVNQDEYDWIERRNLYSLGNLNGDGAGQIRTNGRFCFTSKLQSVETIVLDKINEITNQRHNDNLLYELLDNKVEIHMIFSLCGGTGCGIFLNMAYLLKEIAPKCKLTGYAVMADVFRSMRHAGMQKVKANAYGAIQDLDYLMAFGLQKSDPFYFKYHNRHMLVANRPFDSVICIDNRNGNGDTYTALSELNEMIALALMVSAGKMSTITKSTGDNFANEINEGNMNVENKLAWVGGMGICEIVYNGEQLHHIYAQKAAIQLIEELLQTQPENVFRIDNWVNLQEVGLGIDDKATNKLVDSICLRYIPSEYIEGNTEVMAEISDLRHDYLESLDIDSKVNQISQKIQLQLSILIKNSINKSGGIPYVQEILNGLQQWTEQALKQMEQKKAGHVTLQKENKQKIAGEKNKQKSFLQILFRKRRKIENEECWNNRTQGIAIEVDLARTNGAIRVLYKLESLIREEREKVINITKCLKNISKELKDDLIDQSSGTNLEIKSFQINLAEEAIQKLTGENDLEEDDISLPEFISSLKYGGILALNISDRSEVKQKFLEFTSRLRYATRWTKQTLEDKLDAMKDEEFVSLMKRAIHKSMPLLRYNYRGYHILGTPMDSYYIGVADPNTTVLKKKELFRKLIKESKDLDFSGTGMKDRIIIYRQFGVIPAYAVESVPEYREEYEAIHGSKTGGVNCHIDLHLLTRMQKENYDLYPYKKKDETLAYWVNGLIFKLIKREKKGEDQSQENNSKDGGDYWFLCKKEGENINNHWIKLDKYREESIALFRQNMIHIKPEFDEYIKKFTEENGTTKMKEFYQDVVDHYWEKYSLVGMTRDEVKRKNFETLSEQMNQELKYIEETIKKHL